MEFETNAQLLNHTRKSHFVEHYTSNEARFECPGCRKRFPNRTFRNSHFSSNCKSKISEKKSEQLLKKAISKREKDLHCHICNEKFENPDKTKQDLIGALYRYTQHMNNRHRKYCKKSWVHCKKCNSYTLDEPAALQVHKDIMCEKRLDHIIQYQKKKLDDIKNGAKVHKMKNIGMKLQKIPKESTKPIDKKLKKLPEKLPEKEPEILLVNQPEILPEKPKNSFELKIQQVITEVLPKILPEHKKAQENSSNPELPIPRTSNSLGLENNRSLSVLKIQLNAPALNAPVNKPNRSMQLLRNQDMDLDELDQFLPWMKNEEEEPQILDLSVHQEDTQILDLSVRNKIINQRIDSPTSMQVN